MTAPCRRWLDRKWACQTEPVDRSTRIRVLGPIRVERGGSPIPVRGATGRTVLAALVLADGRVVSNDALIDAVWDDDLPSNPIRDLRSAVSRLRSAIGSDVIETVGNGYRLVPDVVSTDVSELDDVADIAEADRLRGLLDRWDGDALADVNATTSFDAERTRLTELRAQLVDRYHAAMIDEGRAEETLPGLRRDAEASELRESTHLLLMRALAACGRVAEAVRAGNRYRADLVEVTGLDPSAAHGDLMNALLAAEPTLSTSTAAPSERSAPGDVDDDAYTAGRRSPRPPANPFVGRDSEMDLVADALEQSSLVTIVGPGGVGKSRLSQEFCSTRWRDAIFVPLVGLEPGRSVDGAVAAALGIETASVGDLRDAVVDRLAARPERILLDNCEHVLAGVVDLVDAVLRNTDKVSFLATSRRRFGLPDEFVVPLAPLSLDVDDSGSSAVIDLFVDRIRRAGGPPVVDPEELAIVADVCRLLDGLPLALELAAVRVPMLGLVQLRRALVDGVALPAPIATEDDRRQATVDSAVRWSIDLLSPAAYDLFCELCTFPSTFDLDAAVAVTESDQPLDALAELIDSSLVHLDGPEPRYRVLQPIRWVGRRTTPGPRAARALARYLGWVDTAAAEIHDRFVADRRGAAQDLLQQRRDDLIWALDQLRHTGQRTRHGRVADAVARALTDRPDPGLIELCWSEEENGPACGDPLGADITEGLLAESLLSWTVGDFERAVRLSQQLFDTLPPNDTRRTVAIWAGLPAHLYLGDAAAVEDAARRVIDDARLDAAIRAESVGLWILSELYAGRPERSVALLSEHEEILAGSEVGGFVTFTRAEVAMVDDPAARLALLEQSAREAAEAGSSFQQRLIEVARLAVLVDDAQFDEARRLALDLIPRILSAATVPQAWTALRHVARLLNELDEPTIALRILDAADIAPAAPGVTGDDLAALAELRRSCEAVVADHAPVGTVVPIGRLWDEVAAALTSD